MLRHALITAIGLTAVASSASASLLEFNTAGNLGTETSEVSSFNDPTISPSTLSLGAGINPNANGNRLGGNQYFDTGDTNPNPLSDAIADSEFFEFTISPAPAASFSVNNFQFIFDRSATGPGTIVVRSSIDAFAADLATTGTLATANTTAYTTLTFSGLTNLTSATTFRLYAFGATGTTGAGGFDTVTGSTQANFGVNSDFANLPEPASLALLGLGGLAVLRRKR